MAALTPTDLAALNVIMRNSTPFSRLSSSEVDTIFSTMTALGYVINAFGTAGSFINTTADFATLATTLKDKTAAGRLSLSEAVAAVAFIVNTAQFPTSRPAALGVS